MMAVSGTVAYHYMMITVYPAPCDGTSALCQRVSLMNGTSVSKWSDQSPSLSRQSISHAHITVYIYIYIYIYIILVNRPGTIKYYI